MRLTCVSGILFFYYCYYTIVLYCMKYIICLLSFIDKYIIQKIIANAVSMLISLKKNRISDIVAHSCLAMIAYVGQFQFS